MTATTTIPTYRLADSPTGIGWVAVQKWTGESYVHITSFRSIEEAERFISNCYRPPETLQPL